jgi:phage tail sheath gpL-like
MPISTAIDPTAQARALGLEVKADDSRAGRFSYLPQRIGVVGQGASAAVYATEKVQVFSDFEAGTLFGFGSPIHLAVRELIPPTGDGVGSVPVMILPLEDAPGAVAAVFSISASGTQTEAGSYYVTINGIASQAFTIAVGETGADLETRIAAAINAILAMPVLASTSGDIVLATAKWKGASGNGINVAVTGPDSGITFATSQTVSGATNPDVDPALALIGSEWITQIVNCLEVADSTTLGKYNTWGEGRRGSLVHKPAMIWSGQTAASVATAISIPEGRKTDRNNGQIVAPGSVNLPFVVAARGVSRIAKMATENPATDYAYMTLPSITPGADSDQWDFTQRDTAIKGGSSTSEVRDSVVNLSDTVTFYHPTGETFPAYQYAVDQVKLQNLVYNIDALFNSPTWGGGPLIPDDQPTENPRARKPSMAKAYLAAMLDKAALDGMIVNAEQSKAELVAQINGSNHRRLDIAVKVYLSGNLAQTAITLTFGFLFQ